MIEEYQHGDEVEFKLYPGKWEKGRVYAVLATELIIQAGQPPMLYERRPDEVRPRQGE